MKHVGDFCGLVLAIAVASSCGGSTDQSSGNGGGGSGGAATGGSGASTTGGSGGGTDGGATGGTGGSAGSCSPQDAKSDGSECLVELGAAWNGSDCVEIICGCAGTDCDGLFPSVEDCFRSYGHCTSAGDGGIPPWDGGSALCGQVLCASGTSCCNASCSNCAPPDVGCTQEACAPECGPMDAAGVGDCRALLGWVWNGARCVSIGGCSCQGADCWRVLPTEELCNAAHVDCERRP